MEMGTVCLWCGWVVRHVLTNEATCRDATECRCEPYAWVAAATHGSYLGTRATLLQQYPRHSWCTHSYSNVTILIERCIPVHLLPAFPPVPPLYHTHTSSPPPPCHSTASLAVVHRVEQRRRLHRDLRVETVRGRDPQDEHERAEKGRMMLSLFGVG